jgi:hypothetical protein
MRRWSALGITLEEAKQVQDELLRQQQILQAEQAALAEKSSAAAAATRAKGADITTQTATQITAAQAEEIKRLNAAKSFRNSAIVLAVVGSGLAIGTVMFMISRQNKR